MVAIAIAQITFLAGINASEMKVNESIIFLDLMIDIFYAFDVKLEGLMTPLRRALT